MVYIVGKWPTKAYYYLQTIVGRWQNFKVEAGLAPGKARLCNTGRTGRYIGMYWLYRSMEVWVVITYCKSTDLLLLCSTYFIFRYTDSNKLRPTGVYLPTLVSLLAG